MSQSISISIGWPKPKNVQIKKYGIGFNQSINLTWDKIDKNISPFTQDGSGNGLLNVKYRITESYIESLIQYDLEGNKTFVEKETPGNIFDIDNNYYNESLNSGIHTQKCYEIQAIYNYPRDSTDSTLKETPIIITEKTEKVHVKLPQDLYCSKNKCKTTSVTSQKQYSSKMKYSKSILGGINSVSSFNNSGSSKYKRGFLNYNMFSKPECKNSKYFAVKTICKDNKNIPNK